MNLFDWHLPLKKIEKPVRLIEAFRGKRKSIQGEITMQRINITEYITADRYTSRKQLVAMTGLSDRHVRQLIEGARRAGYMIVSNTRSGGYKLAESGAEWHEFVERERHRAIATFKRIAGTPDKQIALEV